MNINDYASEGGEQQALFEWAKRCVGIYPELEALYHVPNEGKQGRRREAESGGPARGRARRVPPGAARGIWSTIYRNEAAEGRPHVGGAEKMD